MRGDYTVDAKGRLNFPAKLRKTFGDTFYITVSLVKNQRCLVIYNQDSWDELRMKLKALPMLEKSALEHRVLGNSFEVSPDSQGRIALAQSLRDFANIKTNVTIMDLSDTAEIWDCEELAKYEEIYTHEMVCQIAMDSGI